MFWTKFVDLCIQRGKSPTPVCNELGFSGTMATKWKNGSVPRDTTLRKISDYFGVPVSYFFEEENKKTAPDVKPNAVVLQDMNVHLVPLYESVSAGFGTLSNDHVIDYVPCFFVSDAEADETLCLKVKGDSMYPKIEDGDVIQVHKQDEADSGSIVVALVDPENGEEEGLVKRIQYGENSIELQSINPMYPPLRFKGPDMNRVHVLGVVKKIIKSV